MTAERLSIELHTAFAARLARSLVWEESAAEDLVQDAWLAVLRRPPRDPEGIRAYLATTLRRLVGRARREAERRERREQGAARREALPSSAELAAAMEEHQRVVAALMDLGESTRTAILLRYLEGLPPREIARRTGEPVETVRTRIKRGLAALRTRLDDRPGGRSAWALALAPLGRSALSVPQTPLGAAPVSVPLATTLAMTTQTKLVLVAVAAIVGGIAWRMVAGDRTQVDLRPSPQPETTEVADVQLPPTSAFDRGGEAEEVRTAVAHEQTVPAEGSTKLLQGSVVVIDADGREHPQEDGSFVLDAGKPIPVAVERGRFELARPPSGPARLRTIELGGSPAYLDRTEIGIPSTGSLELTVFRPRPSVLRVVDARTRADLSDLTILRGLGRSRAALHPGAWDESDVFARGESSPLHLVSFDPEEDWWVLAPGHTWGWLRFDHRTGGEREVALEAGAAELEVRLEPFDPSWNLWVHLFPPDWDPSYQSLLDVRHPTDSRLVFRGLPAGEVQVRAELGIWHDGPHELARTIVELLPGEHSEVVLDLEQNGPLPAAVPLAGTVVLPADHPNVDLSFQVTRADGAALRKGDDVYSGRIRVEPVPGDPRVRSFDAGLVTPGPYLFASPALQVWEPIEVGPAGAPNVEILLPELGEVRIRVVDDETGEPLNEGRIHWTAGRPEKLMSWTLASASAEPGSGEFVFLAPLRRIQVDVDWPEYARASQTVDVFAGSQSFTLRIRRHPGVWLRLVDGEATVPIEWGWSVAITPAAGGAEGEARVHRIENGRAWIAATTPGTYVVELPELDDFLPVPARTLSIGPGAPTEHVIRLERR